MMTHRDLNHVLLSEICPDGTLRLTIGEQPIGSLAAGEILVRIEAAPINPSDIGAMLATAAPASAQSIGAGRDRALVASLLAAPTAALARRLGTPVQIGNEASGTVVDAAEDCKALVGQRVAMLGGAMFAKYRRIAASDCLVLPDDLSVEDGAALFVNPLTALAMIETARRDGHRGIVHTAAASSLGRMLNRLCREEDIPLVNLVRSDTQRSGLLADGASHVLSTSAPSFSNDLVAALVQTRASVAFDAIGGGSLASTILEAMETAAIQTSDSFNNYGSNLLKQLYIYGSLDPSPTILDRRYGLTWAIGGFLMSTALHRFGTETVTAMKARVLAEAKSTFASRYTARIGLDELLVPEIIASIAKRATGEKYLLTPNAQ